MLTLFGILERFYVEDEWDSKCSLPLEPNIEVLYPLPNRITGSTLLHLHSHWLQQLLQVTVCIRPFMAFAFHLRPTDGDLLMKVEGKVSGTKQCMRAG